MHIGLCYMSARKLGEIIHTLFEKCKHLFMNSTPTQEHSASRQTSRLPKSLTTQGWASISALRVVFSFTLLALALLTIGFLADWELLRLAVQQLRGQPWLLVVLVAACTGALMLRAIACRALSSGCIGIYQLFVSVQCRLMVNHLTPVNMGEIARPVLATRYGMPVVEALITTTVARYLDFAALLGIAAVVGAAVSLSTGSPLWRERLATGLSLVNEVLD